MLIRLSHSSHLSNLAAVERSAARKFAEYFKEDISFRDRTLDHNILLEAYQNKSLWIAEEQENIVGFLAATSVDNALHIQEVSVSFEYQGKGIGKMLIKALVAEAKIRGCPYISLTTDSEIPWNKPSYERMGFKEIELKDCLSDLSKILIKDKSHNLFPDNRIAMIYSI